MGWIYCMMSGIVISNKYSNARDRLKGNLIVGFTLVEMSIILVIIGLIIGGVLAGKDLVYDAKIKRLAQEMQGVQLGIQVFIDKYNWLPGDMPTAEASAYGFSSGGTGNYGDSLIECCSTNENRWAWMQLGQAGLITLQPTGGHNIYSEVWDASGYRVGNNSSLGNRLQFAGYTTTQPSPFPALTPHEAEKLDKILDNGQPGSGNMRISSGNGIGSTGCVTPHPNPTAYRYDVSGRACVAYIKIGY